MTPRRAFFILAIAAAMAGSGCDSVIRVRGRVVDDSGQPVADATIRFERRANYRTFGDQVAKDGCFKTGHPVAPGRYQYRLHVVAAGFQAADGAIPTNEDNWAVVVLRRVRDDRPSSIGTAVGGWPPVEHSGGCEFSQSPTR